MEFAYTCRPMKGQRICGDGVLIHEGDDVTLVAVLDGVGHGRAAAHAVDEMKALLADQSDAPLVSLLQACDLALRKTVGVSAALLRFDPATHELCHAAVGNVETLCLTNPAIQPTSQPGIIGGRCRKIVEHRFVLSPGELLLVHTDGIKRSVALEDFSHKAPQEIVDVAMASYGKAHDDVTCLVVGYT